MSGLGRAFFYAGARGLLVSHWPVLDDVAATLTISTFDAMREQPGISRADALQRAMAKVRQDNDKPHFAHPRYWAPFTVVGQ